MSHLMNFMCGGIFNEKNNYKDRKFNVLDMGHYCNPTFNMRLCRRYTCFKNSYKCRKLDGSVLDIRRKEITDQDFV